MGPTGYIPPHAAFLFRLPEETRHLLSIFLKQRGCPGNGHTVISPEDDLSVAAFNLKTSVSSALTCSITKLSTCPGMIRLSELAAAGLFRSGYVFISITLLL